MFRWFRRPTTPPQVYLGHGALPPIRREPLVSFTGPNGQGYAEIFAALNCRNPKPIPVTVATADHALRGFAFDTNGPTICIKRGPTEQVDCIVAHSPDDDTLYADFA